MRVWELLLSASNIGWLAVLPISKKGRRGIPAITVGGISVLLLALHLILEGYRIQLLPLYLTTIGSLAASGDRVPFIPDIHILRPMAANYGLPGFTFEYLRCMYRVILGTKLLSRRNSRLIL